MKVILLPTRDEMLVAGLPYEVFSKSDSRRRVVRRHKNKQEASAFGAAERAVLEMP